MCNQTGYCRQPIRPKKHDRQIASDAIKGRKVRWQRPHIKTLEPQPRELCTLNGSRVGHLSFASINAQYLARLTDLFGEVEGRDTMASGHIQDSCSTEKLKMQEQ